jgi:hypothetical protein
LIEIGHPGGVGTDELSEAEYVDVEEVLVRQRFVPAPG